MGRIRNYINNLNFISTIYFTFIVLATVFLLLLIFNFKPSFVTYQENEVQDLKQEISEIVEAKELEDIIQVSNNYFFEIIIKEDNTVLYTSNSLYDIDIANDVYIDDFIYKEVYEEGDYLIWLVVTKVDMIPFVNNFLIYITSIILTVIIATLLFLRLIYVKSSKPILRILKIIEDLKEKDQTEVAGEDQLDIVSDELLLFYNDVSFRTYQLKQEQEEYKRINKVQKSLIEEQKEYLETVIHEVKSPLASINYSRYIIENKNNDDQLNDSLENIKVQSEGALNLIIEALDTVRDNSLALFIEEDEINVKVLIEEYLNMNKIIIDRNNVKYKINSEIEYLKTNRLKFIQLLNNILSNMLNYSKENTTLEITLSKNELVFKNEIGNTENKYSTNYGKERVEELVKDLRMKMEVHENNPYIVKIIIGDEDE